MDVLDIPLNNFLDAGFFERYPADSQPVTERLNASVLKHGVGQLRPAWERPHTEHPPLSVYKWADTERALRHLASVDADAFDDVALEFFNPHTGGPVMPTFSCWIQLLRPGIATRAHRHTGSSVYLAFEGNGATIIDGVCFEWARGDVFVIPSWAAHEHVNRDPDAPALLFSVHDAPVLKALNKFRAEAVGERGGHQEVRDTFRAADPGPVGV